MLGMEYSLGSVPKNTSCFNCPYDLEDYCNDISNDLKPLMISRYVAIPSIFSGIFSCIGSIIIVYTYCRWKDIRSGSRRIITYLSIADFVTALGYIVGSFNYLINYNKPDSACVNFNTICQIQSFVTTTSSLSSFIWTTILAVYLYVSVVHNKSVWAQKFFPLFHVLGWGLPLVVTVPILATSNLGYSDIAVSTWCYITSCKVDPNDQSDILIFMAGKLWEILCYIVVFVFYILIKIFLRQQVAETKNPGVLTLLRKSDRKLVFIPVMFVLLRMWGTIHFFVSFIMPSSHLYCVKMKLYVVFTVLGILQSIGDGGQGWGNLMLYIVASDKIRNRLISCRKQEESPEVKKPILSGQNMEEPSSNLNKYGTNVNCQAMSQAPTTL